MGIDEPEDASGSDEGQNKSAQGNPAAVPEASEEKGARVDAAKAFFRAMYAGDEPPADAGRKEPASETSTRTACRSCEAMQQQVKEAEQRTNDSEQQYKRMFADFENYRKRMEREREESMGLGVKKAAETIIPALDDLDRAMLFLSPDTPTDKLIDSFKIVSSRIKSSLEQVGVTVIDAVGQQFDPKYHEPVQQIETTEYVDGVVMQELRRGYMLGDKVVRPALVNVASNSTALAPAPEARQESIEPAADSKALEEPEQVNGSDSPPPVDSAGSVESAPAIVEGDEPAKVYDLEDVPDV